MILSVSRRTDIPAFYPKWFMNRLREGFVLVRNPMNPRRVSKISLAKEVLDGIVFWSKNPLPLMPYLDEIKDIPFYFQFTLTSYGQDIEPAVPSKNDVLVPLFIEMAGKFGRDRMVWRYDPILLSKKYTVDYHKKYFRQLAQRLAGSTDQCTISFLDFYKNTAKQVSHLGIRTPDEAEIDDILSSFADSACRYGITLKTCAEFGDYSKYGISQSSCIDKARLEKISGYRYELKKDKNQRGACTCYESIDIGTYNTCTHGCLYCYANYLPQSINNNTASHDVDSPLLIGHITNNDILTPRAVTSAIPHAEQRMEK